MFQALSSTWHVVLVPAFAEVAHRAQHVGACKLALVYQAVGQAAVSTRLGEPNAGALVFARRADGTGVNTSGSGRMAWWCVAGPTCIGAPCVSTLSYCWCTALGSQYCVALCIFLQGAMEGRGSRVVGRRTARCICATRMWPSTCLHRAG